MQRLDDDPPIFLAHFLGTPRVETDARFTYKALIDVNPQVPGSSPGRGAKSAGSIRNFIESSIPYGVRAASPPQSNAVQHNACKTALAHLCTHLRGEMGSSPRPNLESIIGAARSEVSSLDQFLHRGFDETVG
jgi:hypothetical protein